MKTNTWILLLFWGCAHAVVINPEGNGDALLAPYYSVNNNLSTLVTVSNPTNETTAIRINVREGLGGHAVISYNVYLTAYDSWAFALVPGSSQSTGQVGEDTLLHITSDHSCVPFLDTSAVLEANPEALTEGPDDMQRTREGYIEILEMGVVEAEASYVLYSSEGGIYGCDQLQSQFTEPGAVWHTDSGGDLQNHVGPPTGRLIGEVSLIDVSEGINYSHPMVALNQVWPAGESVHTHPEDPGLSFAMASQQAWLQGQHQPVHVEADSGADAVSAVLMAEQLLARYELNQTVNGRTEVILTQPTRHLYRVGGQYLPPWNAYLPFQACDNRVYQGSQLLLWSTNREANPIPGSAGAGSTTSATSSGRVMCGSTFVLSLTLPGGHSADRSYMTGSNNFHSFEVPAGALATQSGWLKVGFLDTRPLLVQRMDTREALSLMGLPVIGVVLQGFSNAGAGQGLLAQYGGGVPLLRTGGFQAADTADQEVSL